MLNRPSSCYLLQGKEPSDVEIALIDATWLAEPSATDYVPGGTVTFTFRPLGKVSVCWHISMTSCSGVSLICLERNGELLFLLNENVNAGHDQTVSAGTAHRQLRRVGYWPALHEPLVTKMNADLRVQWCKS